MDSGWDHGPAVHRGGWFIEEILVEGLGILSLNPCLLTTERGSTHDPWITNSGSSCFYVFLDIPLGPIQGPSGGS